MSYSPNFLDRLEGFSTNIFRLGQRAALIYVREHPSRRSRAPSLTFLIPRRQSSLPVLARLSAPCGVSPLTIHFPRRRMRAYVSACGICGASRCCKRPH